MKWFKDGDQLVLVKDDFINLQESNALFFDWDSKESKFIRRIETLKIQARHAFEDNPRDYYSKGEWKAFEEVSKMIREDKSLTGDEAEAETAETSEYTSKQIEMILTAMKDHGGAFVCNLPKLYALADHENKRKLRTCFKKYFDKYYNTFVVEE